MKKLISMVIVISLMCSATMAFANGIETEEETVNCASCVGCASVANKGILEAERVAAKAAKAQAAKEAAAKAKAAKEAKAKEAATAEKSEGKED